MKIDIEIINKKSEKLELFLIQKIFKKKLNFSRTREAAIKNRNNIIL